MSARPRPWLMPLLALATILFFGVGGALLITEVQERSLQDVLVRGMGHRRQAVAGLGIGLLMATLAWALINTDRLHQVRVRYVDLLGPHVQRRLDRWMVSLCAGVGEELFFRGALQHWLGIPLTAVLFVAIHGYLDPRDRGLLLYGGLLTLFMLGFGWMAEVWGLYAPMAAHALFDAVLLERMAVQWLRRRDEGAGD